MIDIDAMERRITHRDDEPLLPPSPEEVLALIAEIRRLRGENKMLYQMVDDAIAMAAHRRTGLLGPDRVEHRKCQKCTGTAIVDGAVGDHWYWAQCQRCGLLGLMRRTEAEAWAAWDGVE